MQMQDKKEETNQQFMFDSRDQDRARRLQDGIVENKEMQKKEFVPFRKTKTGGQDAGIIRRSYERPFETWKGQNQKTWSSAIVHSHTA